MKMTAVIAFVAASVLSGCMGATTGGAVVPAHVDFNPVPLAAGAATDPFSAFGVLVNDYRAPTLAPLAYNQQLQGAAQTHADNMSALGFFDHQGSDGSMPWDRVTDQGYSWSWVGENIASGQATPDQALTGWKNSHDHNEILLSANPTEFGLAYAPGNYWVMVLARPN